MTDRQRERERALSLAAARRRRAEAQAQPAAAPSSDFAASDAQVISPQRSRELVSQMPRQRLMPEAPVGLPRPGEVAQFIRDDLPSSPEEAGQQLMRGGQMTAQLAHDMVVNIAGLPSDLAVGAQNLVSGGLGMVGVDMEPWQGSPIGSAAFRENSALVGPQGLIPRVEQDQMGAIERTVFNALTFAGEGALTGAAAAGRATARQQAGTYRRHTDTPLQRAADDIGEVYQQTPARAMAVDAAAGMGASLGMEVSDNPIAAIAGAIAGGSLASASMSLRDYLHAQARSRDFPELTRSVASRMVQTIQQASTSDTPQQAAETLARMRTMLEGAGIPAPEAAAMTMDHGIAVLGSVWRQANPGRSAQQMAEFMTETSRYLQSPIRPSNRFDKLEDGDAIDSPLRNVENYARRRAAELRAGAAANEVTAQTNLDEATNVLRNIEAQFINQAAERGRSASSELQGVVRQGVEARRTERAQLYNDIREMPESLVQTVDPTPIRRAFNDIESRNQTEGAPSIVAILGKEHDVIQTWQRVQNLSAREQRSVYNYRRVRNAIAHLNEQSRNLRQAGRFGEAGVVDQLGDAFRAMERQVANTNTPVGQAIRSAQEYQMEEWLPFFARTERGQVGAGAGRTIEQAELGGRLQRDGETFANDYVFRRVSTNPVETAADLAQLREMTNSPELFNQAAQRYLNASAAQATDRNGQINMNAFNRWLDNHAPVLSLFPELETQMYQLGRRVRGSEADIARARERLNEAQVGVTRTDREVREGWMNIFLNNSPTNAIRRVFSSGDAPRLASQAMSDLRASGDPELVRDFQDMTMRYISDRARDLNNPQRALGEEYAVSLGALNQEIRRSRGALNEIFRGNERAMRALENTREMLEMAQYTRVRSAGPSMSQWEQFVDRVQKGVNAAELPLRLIYGHLEAGGKIRSLRLGLQKIPGFNTRAEVDAAVISAFDNPEYLERVLRATPELPPHIRQDVLNRVRVLRAAVMGDRESSREQVRESELQE